MLLPEQKSNLMPLAGIILDLSEKTMAADFICYDISASHVPDLSGTKYLAGALETVNGWPLRTAGV